MAHIVKCFYCNSDFDRDKEDTVSVSERRYAHASCAKKHQELIDKEEKDYEELEKYIKKLFSSNYLTAKIRKQIRDYKRDYGYTFSGMLSTLKWWYELKDGSIDKAQYGIGIIPFVYEDAKSFYKTMFEAASINDDKGDEYYHPKTVVIEIAPPEVKPRSPRLFKMEGINE